jgi:serine/threonine-protein kinase
VPEIPYWLEDIVCQLLEKDPDKRFADAYVLSLRLKEVLKKVELSGKEKAHDLDDAMTLATGDFDGSSATMAVDGTAATSDTRSTPPASAGIGGGTLMRDLVRAEIERTHQPSSLSQLLNNTWVLVGLLGLVVAGGFLWFRNPKLTPEQRFEAGVALMQEEESSDWLKARDEYFLPLIEANAEEWQPRVDDYLARIEKYELRKSFRGGAAKRLSKRAAPASEPERFLGLARSYYEAGDVGRAERTLAALSQMLQGDPKFDNVRQLADELLNEIHTRPPAESDQFLKETMTRAQSFWDEGKKSEAKAIWTSVVALYDGDPRAAADVEIAKKRLNEEKTAGP